MYLFSSFLAESAIQRLFEALPGQKGEREAFLKKTYAKRWEYIKGGKDERDTVDYSSFDTTTTLDKLLTKIAKADPTKNGAYMQWITKLLLKSPQQNRLEDLDRLAQDLAAFELHRAKIANKDINSYPSFEALYDAIKPLLAPRKQTASEKKEAKEEAALRALKGEIDDVYKGPEGWVKIPTTKRASQFLGQNTRWCTASKSGDHFDSYSKTDVLFVIYDKAEKARFQLHVAGGHFADEADKMQGLAKVPKWAGTAIAAWYKEHRPDVGIKHHVAMKGFGAENTGTGTDHEEALDLMKQYGVL